MNSTGAGDNAVRSARRHPSIGDDVVINAGASPFGPITVGRGSTIGHNALVLHDVALFRGFLGAVSKRAPYASLGYIAKNGCSEDQPISYSIPRLNLAFEVFDDKAWLESLFKMGALSWVARSAHAVPI